MYLRLDESERKFLERYCKNEKNFVQEDDLIHANNLKEKLVMLDKNYLKTLSIKDQFREALRKYWPVYLFVIITAISMLYRTKVYADYDHYQSIRHTSANKYEWSVISAHENQCEINTLRKFYTMNAAYDECKTFSDKRDFHKQNAERCFNDAKNLCWYFPAKVRDKSFYAFSTITSLAQPGDLRSKLIGCLIVTLIEYGSDCYAEWSEMNSKLYWAQYHWEQYEFYSEVVRQGNP